MYHLCVIDRVRFTFSISHFLNLRILSGNTRHSQTQAYTIRSFDVTSQQRKEGKGNRAGYFLPGGLVSGMALVTSTEADREDVNTHLLLSIQCWIFFKYLFIYTD